ncbi:MAG TPA: serine/threonine-protein kinase [Gemmatimonadales bacterium]|nr:serine/threonine-protein kinase [Gemmatimonadales bacterium]
MAELGRGGFAWVFKVRDRGLDRWLAAKVVSPELASSAVAMERFRREAATVSRLSHPNIVPILFVTSVGDTACCLMPLVEGEPLASRLKREGPQPVAVAAGIAMDVAAALDHAHSVGVVHRDVKPDNVLLDLASGRALLTDFGIAKADDARTVITTSGQVLGTPLYISPEQASGGAVDARTDVYALGVVVFEMLTGATPFTAANAQALFALHAAARAPDVRELRPDVPAGVAAAVARALEKNPDDRFPSAGQFAEALAIAQPRRSLRTSSATVVERVGAGDHRIFQTEATGSVRDPVAALRGAPDLGALREAVAAARAAVRLAVEQGRSARIAELVCALHERSADVPPAMRKELQEALAAIARDREPQLALARGWLAAAAERPRLEEALGVLAPDAPEVLVDLVRSERLAELVVLADRTGALSEQSAEQLASERSAAIAALLAQALRESLRPLAFVERVLAKLLRHPHPEVRRAALETAASRGGALAERLGRQALSDGDRSVRLAALAALGACGRREAVQSLGAMLDQGSEEEQLAAVAALLSLKLPEAAAPLQRLLEKKSWLSFGSSRLRKAAAAALQQVRG